jgi:hypothetical protein
MLQALIHGKVQEIGGRDPFDVEDLLTGVVLGSASYLDPHQALLPFLAEARSPAGHRIQLPDVAVATCAFWPPWPAIPADASGQAGADAAQPEVVVTLVDPQGKQYLLLIEVKLRSGISSQASPDHEPVGHQLAKYLVHLRQRAGAAGATPLGVIYVTEGITLPAEDIEAAVGELGRKGHGSGAFWWLSWRRFVKAVDPGESRLLRDIVDLLRERWRLTWVDDVWEWPTGGPGRKSPDFFRSTWRWPTPPALSAREWFHA